MASNFDLYSPYATQMAQQYGVPTNLFLWQIGQESSWDPNAHNSTPGSTATGLGQFINSTAQSFGIDPTNPYQSLQAAAQYDAQLYNQTGSWPAAMQAYGTTSGGTQIPAGLVNGNSSPGTLFDFSGQTLDLSAINSYLDGLNTIGNTTTGMTGLSAITNAGPAGIIASIMKYVENYAVVALGIVVLALAIWGLLRRGGTN